jgi:hypothetical protein
MFLKVFGSKRLTPPMAFYQYDVICPAGVTWNNYLT